MEKVVTVSIVIGMGSIPNGTNYFASLFSRSYHNAKQSTMSTLCCAVVDQFTTSFSLFRSL